MRVFAVISNLFPRAREDNVGIKTFYLQVKEIIGIDLDDNLWFPFVWGKVYTTMKDFRQGTYDNTPHCDISISQIQNGQVNIEHRESSDRLHIVSQHQTENSPSIAIENIAAPNNQYTNTQVQLLSVTPIYMILLEKLNHSAADSIFLHALMISCYQASTLTTSQFRIVIRELSKIKINQCR